MNTKTVTISEELNNKIQALQYEVKSRQDLLAYMVSNGTASDSDTFRAYHREYQEYFVQYEAAKAELESAALRPAVPGKLIRWNLDFATAEAVCTYEAEGHEAD